MLCAYLTDCIPKKLLQTKPRGKRPRGRCRTRWLDEVREDIEDRGYILTEIHTTKHGRTEMARSIFVIVNPRERRKEVLSIVVHT